jgi:hypothetical protein
MRVFDADGNEISPNTPPVGEVLQDIALGGSFDETSVHLTVYSTELDRHEVTSLLGVQPSKAWNPGERHPIGNGKSGKTRIVDWGQWRLSTDYDTSDVEDKIRALLSRCTDALDDWRVLSQKYETWLTIGGHIFNWNRELDLAPDILRLLADRGLKLRIDVYSYCEDQDQPQDE